MTDFEDALSSPNDPWSSQEVDKVLSREDVQRAILAWVPLRTVRACGQACGFAADFEIDAAMMQRFKERYEGAHRRQTRFLRKNGQLWTAPKSQHKHFNTATNKFAQVHRLPMVLASVTTDGPGQDTPRPKSPVRRQPRRQPHGEVLVEDVQVHDERWIIHGRVRRQRRQRLTCSDPVAHWD